MGTNSLEISRGYNLKVIVRAEITLINIVVVVYLLGSKRNTSKENRGSQVIHNHQK